MSEMSQKNDSLHVTTDFSGTFHLTVQMNCMLLDCANLNAHQNLLVIFSQTKAVGGLTTFCRNFLHFFRTIVYFPNNGYP